MTDVGCLGRCPRHFSVLFYKRNRYFQALQPREFSSACCAVIGARLAEIEIGRKDAGCLYSAVCTGAMLRWAVRSRGSQSFGASRYVLLSVVFVAGGTLYGS